MDPQRSQPLQLAGKQIHFAGIGGCGMSGLARIARAQGAQVSGSDMAASPFTQALEADGIPLTLRQAADTLPAACDLLVKSAAIGSHHPEVAEALRRDVPVLKYAQMLGRLMIGRTGVAIAGTHGKSTTTAMLAHILIRCGLDPTFIVGATCGQIGGGAGVGGSDLLVAEACEYDRSFLNFHPTHSVVLNVEEDHLDIYDTLEGVQEAFGQFAALAPAAGSLLIHHDVAQQTSIANGLACAVQTIGFSPEADWVIQTHGEKLAQWVSLSREGNEVCRFACRLPGEHMAFNAAVAAVTAARLGGGWEAIVEALGGFEGLERRMQPLGEAHGVTVIDDYGHHPTEIHTTLRSLREAYRPEARGGRLICVFQPHQHSRTRFLLEQFAQSFSEADVVIVPHIYFVRDSAADRKAVSAADLVARLRERGVEALHLDSFEQIVAHLKEETHAGDLLVVMGAGPVWQVAHDFVAS